MLLQTRQAIKGIIALDPSINKDVAAAAVTMLETGKVAQSEQQDKTVDGPTAAAMLGISRRSLNNFCKRGLVRRVGGKLTRTRERFSLRSNRDYIEGKTTVAANAA